MSHSYLNVTTQASVYNIMFVHGMRLLYIVYEVSNVAYINIF